MSDTDINSPQPLQGADTSSALGVAAPSWQEQDVVLRDLWTQNKTPQEISEALHRSIAAIMTRAARLGLPRRSAPGRKPGSNRRLAADEMGRPQVRSNPYKTQAEAKAPTSTRVCLMCLRSFPSQGRHNRICASCKGSSEYESAVALADISISI